MDEIKKVLRLQEPKYYEVHLSLLNSILPIKMTPKEIEVLACFMSLKGDIATTYRFGPSGRKIVMETLNISPAGLTNYISSLLKSGFLIKAEGIISILPILIPSQTFQDYRFRLVNQTNV
jgi:DNA-binding MarR family transcriptional regulator